MRAARVTTRCIHSETLAADPKDMDAIMKIAILDSEIAEGDLERQQEIPIEMTKVEGSAYNGTADQYLFATVYEQEFAFYTFRQESMTTPRYFERFNTKVEIANSVGVTRQHKGLLNYVAQELHNQDFLDT